jgi:hypothetical protein
MKWLEHGRRHDEITTVDARRKRWLAALGLFFVWVAVLGAMAVFSGRRPMQHDHPRLHVPR